MTRLNSFRELEYLRERTREERKQTSTVMVCGGTGCRASRSLEVIESMRQELANQGMQGSVRLCVTGCHGFCEQGPVMIIEPGNLFYCHLSKDDAFEIVSQTLARGKVIERLLYTDPDTGEKVRKMSDIPFYRAQDRQVLSQNLNIDPCSILDYIAAGGYSALARVLRSTSPEEVVSEVKKSGLRGRGGGGFPTGRKWEECRKAAGTEKYVICNADEGDPGAYMDRCVLEGNPHLILEGMMIGAWAVGAGRGYVYVRNEYPLAVEHTRTAVQQARELGLLGKNILGTPFSFDIEIARGGGAFVCGESTALMASIEGKVGEPRAKDVHATADGLFHKPTVLNNVETWANVPAIVNKGSSWFAEKGAGQSKGAKILALTGKIKNTGLVEVEMGTPLSRVLYDIGGGSSSGKPIKAVQIGGPSGGCLPADKFDLPLDYDVLAGAGSMVGSGGMVVMDEESCMVDVAKYFLNFLQDESCGKCLPCRVGIDRMLEIINGITEGKATMADLDLLAELAETVADTSLCGLGKTAPNPVLTTLRYFRKEYEAHVLDRRCPAGVCKGLITYRINPEKCTGCGICQRNCPQKAVSGTRKAPHTIDAGLCRKCGICRSECRFDAVEVF